MNKDNEKNTVQKTKASAPGVPSLLNQKRIKIFKSLEESKQDKISYINTQSPVERLRQTVELILRVYNVTRESLKEKKYSNRINILKS